MPTTALIADDEEAPRAQLRRALQQAWPGLQIVAEAANGVDAWDAYLEHEPQVCFLDIRMPGLSGIDVARRIGPGTPVVFVTAFGDHALAAFDAGAVDYLMKPVDPERVAQTVQRLHQRRALAAPLAAASQPPLQELLAQLQPRRSPLQVLQASVGREVRLIRTDEVVYFESDSRYTRVVFEAADRDSPAGGDALIRTPLKELLAQLDDSLFWQVHRSIIVNHRHIASAVRVDEGHMHLTLRGRPETLPVSRHFQALFKGQ
jgi:DNA-binding LytR/AlgR family response regulator